MAHLSSAETVQSTSSSRSVDRIQHHRVGDLHARLRFRHYEATIMQLVTPLLIKEWGIAPATIGNITTISRWVGLIGIFVFPTLADLYGRRPVLVLTILGYSLFTGLTGFAQGPTTAADLHLDHAHHAPGRDTGRHDHGERNSTDEMARHRARGSRRRVPVRLHAVLADGSRSRAAVGMAVSILDRNPASSAGSLGPAGDQREPTFRACH